MSATTDRLLAALGSFLDDELARAHDFGVAEQKATDQPVIASLRADVTDRDAKISLQQRTIADLQAKLDELTKPVPPVTRQVAYGWNVGGWWKTGGQSPSDAYAQAKAAFGTPKVLRVWANRIAADLASLLPAYLEPGTGAFVNLGSDVAGVNAGRYDATLTQMFKSAPTDRDVWVSLGHEPENDGGSFTLAQWQAAQARIGAIKAANAPKNIRLVALLMGSTFMTGRYSSSAPGNRPAAEWFAFDLKDVDCLGTDIYQWGKTDPGDTAALVVQPCIDLARKLGKGLVVGELGARNLLSDAARAKFLTDAVALFDANSDVVEAVAYFENDNGDLGPWNLLPKPGTTTPSLPKAVAAWRAAIQS